MRPQRAHQVVGLGVVGAQHQLREVADHLGALLGGVVHGPVGARLHRLVVAYHRLQGVLRLRELGLVGDGVVEGVAVLVDADLLEQRLLLGDDDLGARRGELVLGAGELRARLEHLLLAPASWERYCWTCSASWIGSAPFRYSTHCLRLAFSASSSSMRPLLPNAMTAAPFRVVRDLRAYDPAKRCPARLVRALPAHGHAPHRRWRCPAPLPPQGSAPRHRGPRPRGSRHRRDS